MQAARYKWVICAVCCLLMFTITGLCSSAFSVYLPYLISHGGLTKTETSTLITIRSFVSFLVMFGVTKYYEKLDIRLGAALAILSAVIGFFIYSTADSYRFCAAAAAFVGIAYGLGGMIPITILINRWFLTQKATALGICSAGSGIASIVVPPVITSIVETHSLSRAFWMEAAFMAAAMLIFFLLAKNRPDEGGGGAAQKKKKEAQGRGLSRAGLAAMILASVMIGAIAVPGNVHLAVLFKTEGYEPMQVAYVLSMSGLALIGGKLIYGIVTDKIGAFRSNFLFMGLIIAGLVLCCLADRQDPWLPFAAVLILGFGFPVATVGLSVWSADLSSPEDFEVNVKRFQMSYVFGTLSFSVVPGLIADACGSYIPAYMIFAGMAALALLLVQMVYGKTAK